MLLKQPQASAIGAWESFLALALDTGSSRSSVENLQGAEISDALLLEALVRETEELETCSLLGNAFGYFVQLLLGFIALASLLCMCISVR
jgi:hypothetical protein